MTGLLHTRVGSAVPARSRMTRARLRSGGSSVLLVAFAVLMLLPILLLLSISLQSSGDASRNPFGLPTSIHFDNYVRAFRDMNFLRGLANTTFITAATVVLVVLFGSLAAWAIARNTRKWSNILYSIFVAGLTIPIFVTMTPLYLLMQQLGLLDTYWAVILSYTALNLPLAVFFFSSFLRTVPPELEEAAAIDGVGLLRTYWHIVLPLLRPTTATLVIFIGLSVWNDLVIPLLFLTSDSSSTIILSVYSFVGQYGADTSVLFPAVVLSTIPLFVVFVLLQRYVVAGVAAGAGK